MSARRARRRGKGSRARRLVNHMLENELLRLATCWERLARGALSLARAKQRDEVKAALAGELLRDRAAAARELLRAVVQIAWTCPHLYMQGPSQLDGRTLRLPRGAILEPLSYRDMWVLQRASKNAALTHVPALTDPMQFRFRRHVLDWLRKPLLDGKNDYGNVHWNHTNRAEDRSLTYSSDEDDGWDDA